MVVARLLTTKFPLACFLMELALQLQRQEADLELFWLPRLQNEEADALTNQCYITFDPAQRCRFDVAKFEGIVLNHQFFFCSPPSVKMDNVTALIK